MLDIGWPELMLIAVATIIVVGPRELPRVLRTVNGYVRKARSLASEFQNSVEDMAREADLDDLKKQWKETGGDFSGDLEKSMDPTGEVSSSMRDIKDTMNARYTDGSSAAPSDSVVPPGEGTTDEGEPGPLPPKPADSSASDTDAGGTASAKKTAAKKGGAKKGAAKKTTARKAGSKAGAAKKSPTKTSTAKTGTAKTGAKKAGAKKAGAKSAGSKGAGTKSAGAKKATAKKTAAKSAAPAAGASEAPARGGGSGAG